MYTCIRPNLNTIHCSQLSRNIPELYLTALYTPHVATHLNASGYYKFLYG